MVLRLSLSQPPWWYFGYPYTHHSLFGGPQSIPNHITFCFVVLRVSLYRVYYSLHISSDNPYIHHSLPGGSDNPYTHHSLFGGPQSIPIHIKFCLVVLIVSLYASESLWWYSEYPYTHHSLPGGTQTKPILISLPSGSQTVPLHITVSLVALRLSLYSSQFPWWNSDYPYTHPSLPGGTQSIPILITIYLVELRLSLYSSQSPWWYSDFPYEHHSLPDGPQTTSTLITVSLRKSTHIIPILITVSLVVLRLSL